MTSPQPVLYRRLDAIISDYFGFKNLQINEIPSRVRWSSRGSWSAHPVINWHLISKVAFRYVQWKLSLNVVREVLQTSSGYTQPVTSETSSRIKPVCIYGEPWLPEALVYNKTTTKACESVAAPGIIKTWSWRAWEKKGIWKEKQFDQQLLLANNLLSSLVSVFLRKALRGSGCLLNTALCVQHLLQKRFELLSVNTK